MNIERHFIPPSFYYVSVYEVLNITSVRAHFFNLVPRFLSARLAMVSGIPEIFAAQGNNVLWKHFSNDLHGCSPCMVSCTIMLEPYGRELSSGVRQFRNIST
jgi:hypothetical protein